ncbi:MAG: triose-phosphate isomerase [Pseudanabaenaceae cyanobacterium]
MSQTLIAGNWKMHKNQSEAKHFMEEFLSLTAGQQWHDREVLLCVPFTDLGVLQMIAPRHHIHIGAQNLHWAEVGPYTGEISALMLVELGIKYVIVGHSERRQFFGETDETVNKRLLTAQKYGLTPILCVGENKEQRLAGETETVIFNQLDRGLAGVDQQQHLVIAYEPIWAIGTGQTCKPEEANRVISLIRNHLQNHNITILYGGSVRPNNIDEIMAQPEINGVLVGGASLDPTSFARIVNFN